MKLIHVLARPSYVSFRKINYLLIHRPVTMYYHSERQITHSFWLKLEQRTQNYLFRSLFLGITIVSTFLYVFQINTVTTSGYRTGQLQKQIATLETENRQIAVQLAEKQSIARLSTELQSLGYVPIDRVEYASIGTSVVAKR